MAKKTVATLQTGGGKDYIKCIKAVKTKKKQGHAFEEKMIHKDKVKDFFNK
ncbi:MAG: DUF4295 domain-containing protein [Bacteroidota bacterium]